MPDSLGYFYLAGPYRGHPGGLDAAYNDAVLLSARLIDLGFEIFSPIVHGHPLAKFVQSADSHSDFWLARQMPMMMAARGIIVAQSPGWDKSEGVIFERAFFRSLARPEYIVDPSRDTLNLETASPLP
jgi:hypothetical protein